MKQVLQASDREYFLERIKGAFLNSKDALKEFLKKANLKSNVISHDIIHSKPEWRNNKL